MPTAWERNTYSAMGFTPHGSRIFARRPHRHKDGDTSDQVEAYDNKDHDVVENGLGQYLIEAHHDREHEPKSEGGQKPSRREMKITRRLRAMDCTR